MICYFRLELEGLYISTLDVNCGGWSSPRGIVRWYQSFGYMDFCRTLKKKDWPDERIWWRTLVHLILTCQPFWHSWLISASLQLDSWQSLSFSRDNRQHSSSTSWSLDNYMVLFRSIRPTNSTEMIDKKVKKTQIEQSKNKEKYFNHEKIVMWNQFWCTCVQLGV